MRLVFVSNYLNHHQIPFCDALYRKLNGSFCFVQMQPMEQERIQMGWNSGTEKSYLRKFYEEQELCKNLIDESDFLILGWVEDESLIVSRFASGKPIFRYMERIYRSGQWKAISPRGLRKKYQDHVKYRHSKVYLLCSGGYVSSDFGLIHAYPGKMFCWGYFPETRHYALDELMKNKGYEGDTLYILWAARLIKLKQPELAVEAADYLRNHHIHFHMDIIGGGELEAETKEMIHRYHLDEYISLKGFMKPAEVREHMEKAHIFLFTSNRLEGWGAVINEAMNSGCAVVAGHMAGAVPYLIQHRKNGLIYQDGKKEQLFEHVLHLASDPLLRKNLGKNAYDTITRYWNADFAAKQLTDIMEKIENHEMIRNTKRAEIPYPGAPDSPMSERKMYRYLMSHNQ